MGGAGLAGLSRASGAGLTRGLGGASSESGGGLAEALLAYNLPSTLPELRGRGAVATVSLEPDEAEATDRDRDLVCDLVRRCWCRTGRASALE